MKSFIEKLKPVDRRKIFLGSGLLLFFIAVFVLARLNNLYSNINTQSGSWASPIPKEKKVFNLLLMGYGGPGHDGAYLTDTMIFASVDTENKRVTLVSLPRDIWVEIPTIDDEDFYRKINSVYQTGLFKQNYPGVSSKYEGEHGASILLKEIVQKITGQEIDNYIAVDFDGFKKVVDTLDGVQVDVERSFIDPLYPVDGKESDLCGLSPDDSAGFQEKEAIATESPELAYPCRYEVLSFDAGVQIMDGETALKFVRSRHSPTDGGDFNRARRQQLFIEALRDRVLSLGFIPKILPLMDDLEESIRTDMPIDLIQRLLKEAPSAQEYEIRQVVLTTDNYLEEDYSDDGQYILVSQDGLDDWNTFQADLKLYLRGITPTPSPTPLVTGGAL